MGLSTIQWCDFTENFWLGCTFAKTESGVFIPECFNCYAKLLDDNRYSKTLDRGSKEHPMTHWGDSAARHRTSEANWRNPLIWNRKAICTACGFAEWIGSDDCRKCGRNFSEENRRRPRVFSLSLGRLA